MLTKADDYPVHQLPEPIATAGTDRNFYDRYFFNGYAPDGSTFFACALGVYPHLNIMDAAFSVIDGGVQRNLHASRILNMERMDTSVGPISIEVIEPLKKLRVRVSSNEYGIEADITFTARAKPVEEPRFTYRIGPSTFMDYTRLTQNGAYEGFVSVKGKRIAVDSKWLGTRDRSWGVRPVGLQNPQPIAPPRLPQFYWIWAPLNFEDRFMLYHNNAEASGRPWNQASVIGTTGEAEAVHMTSSSGSKIDFKSGTRHAKGAVIETTDPEGNSWRATITPKYNFYMSGIGYTHPEWGHGHFKGENALGYEEYETASVNENDPRFLHVQAISSVKLEGPNGLKRDGVGVLEQLIIGPHAPSGFKEIFEHRAMSDDISPRLAAYLAKKLGVSAVDVDGLSRISGGASRETYRFSARYYREGRAHDRALILRRDPPASLIDTERSAEFRAYQAFHKMGLPVPEPVALELGTEALDRPFFIMEEIRDCSVASVIAPDPYGAHATKIGHQFFSILGKIAKAEPDKIGLGDFEGARTDSWKHEVERWEREIDEDEREPQPIVRAAIRWLKRNPPPPAQKASIVHGDYRSGNFLYDAEGSIRAILDWEMAHIGDPLEDLGWAIDPLWSHFDPARPGGLVSRENAILFWEQASGLKAEPRALFWWEIFASLKGAAIWISAAREYGGGRNTDPVNLFSGWYCLSFHNKVLADRLSAVGA